MKLAIYGSGGLGRETLELANTIGKHSEIIFIDDTKDNNTIINGHKTLTYEYFKLYEDKNLFECIIAIGEPYDRKCLFEKLEKDGYKFANLIHPSVQISNTTTIGKGCIIQTFAIISCNTTIGNNVVIADKVTLSHDSIVGDNTIVSSGVLLAGHVSVGKNTFIAMSVLIIQEIKIGDSCIIGAMSMVNKDIVENSIAYGIPAKVVKKNIKKKVF
ncbi:MAG: acetyltransferase [Eubacteriales bacterium]|nr:acetyltransferase [Eubacteriales bacterium]